MKRNNFLKSFLAIPFIAPLLGKSEEIKPSYVYPEHGMLISYKNKGIYVLDKHFDNFVWTEEDIKEGVWVKAKHFNSQFSFGFMQIGLMKTWGDMSPRYVLHDNGVTHGGYTAQSKKELADGLNFNSYVPASKAEVIEMILESKNFI